jgi:hypothetical protein
VLGECKTASDCKNAKAGDLCDSNHTCTPCSTDAACKSGYGGNYLCVGQKCIPGDCRDTVRDCANASGTGGRICGSVTPYQCGPCSLDTDCGSYPQPALCVNGSCIPGNCHLTQDCAASSTVCDPNTYFCSACTDDTSCTLGYGQPELCISGTCVPGVCRTSPQCNGGLCDTTNHTCGSCSTDAECVAAYSGSRNLCIGGSCVSGTCHTTIPTCSGGGQICDGSSHQCVGCASDGACLAAYGPAQQLCEHSVCIVGECRTSAQCSNGKVCDTTAHACVPCANDATCSNDTAYGSSTICLSGACTAGECHGSSADCSAGQLCGITQPSTCGACGTDGQCTSDPVYGAGNICFQGICQAGNCHGTSADCTGANAGLICGAGSSNTCGSCTSDAQCQADTTYGSSTICHTAAGAGAGTCVGATCSASGACAANGADFCCGGLCTPGNCCSNSDCAAGKACVNNTCTGCSAPTGNKYYVDPVNGSDGTATGSGMVGGQANSACSFKTVTKALETVGGFAVPGTQIIIVGSASSTISLDPSEMMPFVVPANVTITTKTGPIHVTLPATSDPTFASVSGFQLSGDQSGITPDPAAPLTLDGSSNTSGVGIGVAPGTGKTSSLTYVTVQNTGGHGILVTNGTLNLGQGVTAQGAGTAAKKRDGLNVSGGTVNINVGSGQAPTSFLANTEHGIYVTGAAVLNVSAVPVFSPAPNGQGTVVVSGNANAGVHIFEAPGAAGTSTLSGLVSWGNQASGLKIYGGSKLKVRNSVFLNNGTNGVYILNFNTIASGNDLSQIDLGTTADLGGNYLQALLGSNPDLTGLCVTMSAGMGALSLKAAGNVFAGPTNCAVTSASLVRFPYCTSYVDIGVVPQTGTTVTVDASNCH